MITYDQIKKYSDAGLCIVPTHFGEKRPALMSWTQYQKERPMESELRQWFSENANRDGMGIICGAISGGLEVIDFDQKGQEFPFWAQSVQKRAPELYPKLVIEKSYSGGKHVFYKCEDISGSQKLAMQDKTTTLIETRGQGGFVKCAPSEGYELEQGDLDNIPVVTVDEREILLSAARCRNLYIEEDKADYIHNVPATGERKTAAEEGTLRPGDDYNVRGNFHDLLIELGWKPFGRVGADGNQKYTRPGKDKGTSATLKTVGGIELLYVFTSSTDVENGKAYTPFQFLTREKFGGDWREAAKYLGGLGYGKKRLTGQVIDNTVEVKTVNNETIKVDKSLILSNPNIRDPESFNEFPLDRMPPVCRKYIIDQARAQARNPAGIAAFLLTQCGAILGASVRVRLKHKWKVPPILWTCLIGVSGQGKSPQLDAVKSLITPISDKFEREYQAINNKYALDYSQWLKNRKRQPEAPEPVRPKHRRIFVTNATFEGLAKDEAASGSRTPLILDELVDFFTMTKRTKTPGESAKWLSGYSGGAIVTSRVNAQEVYLNDAYWSIYGGATPEKFRKYITEDGGDKDGTLTRMMLVWAPMLTEYPIQATEEEYPLIEKHSDDMQEVCETLVNFSPGTDYDGEPNEQGDYPLKKFEELTLCDEAREMWEKMRIDNFYLTGAPENSTDAVAGFLSKSLEFTGRIAVILHCINAAWNFINGDGYSDGSNDITGLGAQDCSDDGFQIPPVIDMETWVNARVIAEWFITETLICYELLKFVEPKSASYKATSLLNMIASEEEGLSLREIYRKERKYRTKTGKIELQKLLDFLEEKNYIYLCERKSKTGPPTKVYKSVLN